MLICYDEQKLLNFGFATPHFYSAITNGSFLSDLATLTPHVTQRSLCKHIHRVKYYNGCAK